ncbi:MAG: VWA domain-containing protein [Micromonosporaceae bacterium]|jgi:Ca-activated chloride channel family protein|nr:VWA domain-containing protein [Micromonosporaceae bacterium]
MTGPERDRLATGDPDAGLGALRTERGNLPLELVDVQARLTGLAGAVRLTQGFTNPYDQPLEATYVFPLPDRFAVTGMTMTAADRTVQAELRERAAARAEYEQAVAEGKRAAIAEEERPDVFTMRVGNILPGERVSVELSLAGPLSYEDGEATFRFPLVVAPRYIPGKPLDGTPVGDGYAPDTDAVPDASRITPPVLLPGFPNPVRLSIAVTVDPGGLPLGHARCSLPIEQGEDGTIRVTPGQRLDRDFVLRLQYGEPVHATHGLVLVPDVDGAEGTFQLTVLPPTGAAAPRPRDVVLVLDRSGSMGGWKMVAARRAAARIIDTLTGADRFAVLTFDNVVERPADLPAGLAPATDRHRFRAVEHLARAEARGGTEMLRPLREALDLLTGDSAAVGEDRDRVLVLVTDGQVGNEDQILRETAAAVQRVRLHTVGIDQAVNAGFLGRLAAYGGGRCELVESEDRLDEAMDHIHRRIGTPLLTGLTVHSAPGEGGGMEGQRGIEIVPDTVSPARHPDLFPGAPVVFTGRFRGSPAGGLQVRGRDLDGQPWQAGVEATTVDQAGDGIRPIWARAHLRDLEDRYVTLGAGEELTDLERRIVDTSLRFGALCRFTAFVAVDSRVVTDGSGPHRVIQPVEPAAGWDMLRPPPVAPIAGAMTLAAMIEPGSRARAARKVFNAGWQSTSAAHTAMGPGTVRQPKPHAPQDDVRDLAALELSRLRSASAAGAHQRRQLLDDLATRLSALVGELARPEVAELLEAIRSGRGDVDELWARALRVLEKLAGPAAAGERGAQPPRTPFWKR